MTSIAVTGAAGAVGHRVVQLLAAWPGCTRLVAIDKVGHSSPWEGVESVRLDLAVEDPASVLAGIDTVVHLAEDSRRGDTEMAGMILDRVLAAGSPHLVLLSSALVYGAYPDNPVPLTESEKPRPNPGLQFASAKWAMERQAESWAEAKPGRGVAVMRPTVTLSEGNASWVASAIRAASAVRSDQLDPPVQFLHHDDLASAVAFVVTNRLEGTYNVAPDGWIGPEAFRELVGRVQVRVPEVLTDQLLRTGRKVGVLATPEGIEPYVRHPWVVANDRLRHAGWQPAFTNAEAFVLGTPPALWSLNAQRRQEIALAAVGVGVAGVATTAAFLARRLKG